MWWITIVFDVIFVIAGFVFCTLYYNKHYGDCVTGELKLSGLRTFNVLYGNCFQAMKGFTNYSSNVLLKGIITLICILIVHFTDSLWITYLYLPYLLLTYFTYKTRVKLYKSVSEIQRDTIRPSFVASFVLPFFHTLFLVLVYMAYALNV